MPFCNIWSRLVIVEGIMGSGKSTTVLRIADRLNTSGVPVLGITEGTSPHTIRFDGDQPWAEMPATQLAKSALACCVPTPILPRCRRASRLSMDSCSTEI